MIGPFLVGFLWLRARSLYTKASLTCVYNTIAMVSIWWLYPPKMCIIFMGCTRNVGSSSNMRQNYQKTQTYCSHPPFVSWLISMQILITARRKDYIFNPFCQRAEIYMSISNERRQEEGKYGQESATLEQRVMSGGVSDKKETNQRSITLHSTASSTSR